MYKQGTLVNFKISDNFSGLGKICGIGINKQPFLGTGYIVEIRHLDDDSVIDDKYNEYTHLLIFERFLTKTFIPNS